MAVEAVEAGTASIEDAVVVMAVMEVAKSGAAMEVSLMIRRKLKSSSRTKAQKYVPRHLARA
jgi:hypothetical protein